MKVAVLAPPEYWKRKCDICGEEFTANANNQKRCSLECVQVYQDRWKKQKGKGPGYCRTYRQRHPLVVKENKRKWRHNKRLRLRAVWGAFPNGSHKERIAAATQIEDYIATQLPKHGYTDVQPLRDVGGFPFDLRGEMDGIVHVFNVTSTLERKVGRYIALASKLGVKYSVVHVKPDKSTYVIKYPMGAMSKVSLPDLRVMGLYDRYLELLPKRVQP